MHAVASDERLVGECEPYTLDKYTHIRREEA